MREEHVLDLGRVHVLAAADDHVLLAVHEREESLVVETPEIAGLEPAVRGERVGRRVGPPPVTREDVRAVELDLADLIGPGRPAVLVDDAHLDMQERLARGGELAPPVVDRHERAARRRLGEAISLQEAEAARRDRLHHCHRMRRAAGDAVGDRREVRAVEVRPLEQLEPDRRHAEDHADAEARHQAQQHVGIELAHDRDATADIQRRDEVQPDASGVKEGEEADGRVVGSEACGRPDVLDIPEDVRVREHRPFGMPGGPGRVQDEMRVVEPRLCVDGQRVGRAGRDERLVYRSDRHGAVCRLDRQLRRQLLVLLAGEEHGGS